MLTKQDLKAIDGLLNKRFKKELKPVHRKLDKLQDDLNATIRVFDLDIVDLKKRVDRVETHLNLPSFA